MAAASAGDDADAGEATVEVGHAYKLSDEVAEDLKCAFQIFDTDGTGSVCTSELYQLLSTLGLELKDSEIASMISEHDTDCDNKVRYSELVSLVTAHMGHTEDRGMLEAAFEVLDTNNTGLVTKHDLVRKMGLLGFEVTEGEVDRMFAEAEAEDGMDISQFCKMIGS